MNRTFSSSDNDAFADFHSLRMVNVPPPNYISELFRRYMRAQHMTAADVGARIGCTPQNVNAMLNRVPGAWRISEIQRFCAATNCPFETALEAIGK